MMMEWTVTGQVVYGKQLGRTIGFPTANLNVDDMPEHLKGVYYAETRVDGQIYRVILNIGSHPTVPEGPPTVEAHLLDFSGNLYGRKLTLRVRRYLRAEKRFDSLKQLTQQLEADREAARQMALSEEEELGKSRGKEHENHFGT